MLSQWAQIKLLKQVADYWKWQLVTIFSWRFLKKGYDNHWLTKKPQSDPACCSSTLVSSIATSPCKRRTWKIMENWPRALQEDCISHVISWQGFTLNYPFCWELPAIIYFHLGVFFRGKMPGPAPHLPLTTMGSWNVVSPFPSWQIQIHHPIPEFSLRLALVLLLPK